MTLFTRLVDSYDLQDNFFLLSARGNYDEANGPRTS